MRKYETLVLLSPELNEEERIATLTNLKGVIEREKGQILKVDEWGMRDLAYPVRKMMRGFFVRLEFLLDSLAVQELERNIRISEHIFKFVTVLLDENGVVPEEA
jgi:small subunit ribosomal protein S6